MNNTLKIFCLASLAVIGLASCSKNTDLEPSNKLEPSSKNENNVKEEINPQVMGVYRYVYMRVDDNRKDKSRNIDFQFSSHQLHCGLAYYKCTTDNAVELSAFDVNNYISLKDTRFASIASFQKANLGFRCSSVFDWGQEFVLKFSDEGRDQDFLRMRIDGSSEADHPGDIRLREKWRRDDVKNLNIRWYTDVGEDLNGDWSVFVGVMIE